MLRGVLITSCPVISVGNNTINSVFTGPAQSALPPTGNLNSRGFDINSCSGSVVGNSVSNTNVGLAFSGNCGLAENFRENNIGGDMNSKMDVGLWIQPNSSIGHQTCPLNIWRGTFNAHGAYWETGNPAGNEIVINYDDFSEWPISLPSQNPPNIYPTSFWFIPDITNSCPKLEFTGGGDEREGREMSFFDQNSQNDIPSVNQISIQPNPSKEMVRILVPDLGSASTIEIYDLAGKLVYGTKITLGQTTVDINISPFSEGIYLLKIRSKDFVHTEKIVKN